MTAGEILFERGSPDGSLAPIYNGILKHLDSMYQIENLLLAFRPVNEHWKVDKNAAAVLWPLFLEKIPHFQEAIVAVSHLYPFLGIEDVEFPVVAFDLGLIGHLPPRPE